jgi:hypothetical protein
MIKKPSITLSRARLLSSLIAIRFGDLRFWKAFNGYRQNVGLNYVTSGVITSKELHSSFQK